MTSTIPSDWRVEPLAAVSERIMVGIASAATHAYRSTGVPMLRNQNIKSGRLDDSDVLFIDPGYEKGFRSKRLQPGDLITARTGYPGATCVVPKHYEAAQSFTTLITRPNSKLVDSDYLCYYINSEQGQSFVTQSQIGGAQQNINAGAFRLMPIWLPPLDEQRAIADALIDVDSLITTLERRIVKMEDIKQGVVQQLLTGRTRLPGFTQPWIQASLGSLGSFLKGRGVKREDVRDSGIPCIRYGELYTEFDDYTSAAKSFVEPGVAAAAVPLRCGDLLFAGSGETRDEIGKCVAYIGPIPAVAGGDIVILRGSEFNPTYLALLANTPEVANQKSRAGQGDAVVHISSRALAAIQVALPPRPEQDAIARVIVDTDHDIRSLGSRVHKARAVKDGMMQQLLSGRTRLPVNEAAS